LLCEIHLHLGSIIVRFRTEKTALALHSAIIPYSELSSLFLELIQRGGSLLPLQGLWAISSLRIPVT
jgi:hypothetical protein